MDDLHDSFEKGIIEPVHMRSQDLPADALTKSLSGPILAAHRAKMNLHRVDDVRCDDTKGNETIQDGQIQEAVDTCHHTN